MTGAQRAKAASLSGDKAGVAHYILELSSELKAMAEAAQLDFLAYLLDMVGAEAQSAARQLAPLSGKRRQEG